VQNKVLHLPQLTTERTYLIMQENNQWSAAGWSD